MEFRRVLFRSLTQHWGWTRPVPAIRTARRPEGSTDMATEIKVPALGESVTEATLSQWLKKPGDAVAVDEPIASLETDKVAVDVPSPVAGVLSELKLAVGDPVEEIGSAPGRGRGVTYI